jgi:hypothetical protein
MMRCNVLSLLLFGIGSIAIGAIPASAQFSFTALGMYEATGVSGDGSVIVGYSFPSPRWAYRWTPATGTQPMSFWFDQSSGREVVPLSISDDGSVMVGAFYERRYNRILWMKLS